MYNVPEPRYYLEPKEGEIVGYVPNADKKFTQVRIYGKSKERGIANVV